VSAPEPRKILVVTLLPIGDTLFTTPALHALRLHHPQAHIVVLAYPMNRGILIANPDVDEIWLAPTREAERPAQHLLALMRKVRSAAFDLLVQFSYYDNGLRYWSGIPRGSHMRLPALWWLRPGAGRKWRQYHAVQHYATVVRRLGIPIRDWRLRMYATLDEIAACDQLLHDHGVRPDEPVIGLHPGGEGLGGKKQWSPAGFAEVADGLYRQFGVKILVLGGKEDARAAAEVAAASAAPVLNLAGQTTLGATAAIAARCALFIGNDSSPLHIALTAGTRVVGIYGITDPHSYHPWLPGGVEGRDYAIVRSAAPCAGCYPLLGGATLLEQAACTRCDALSAITPDQVLAAAVPLLEARRT
jgi:ADP-heptose:LPS heptosyltransferase